MSDSKRQCSKCQFFQIAQLSGNGWCTHPKRQVASDIKILVREKELACRNSWGDDLWIDAAASLSSTEAVASPRKGLFYVNSRVDDEVTSVVDTTSRQSAGSAGRQGNGVSEDVVTLTSVRRSDAIIHRAAPLPGENDLNSPAIADQAERAWHMARGNKDAIQKARERHSQRRKPTRESIEPEPAGPAADELLVAQDWDQYNQGPPLNDRAPADDHRNTPPVPREEVEANGTPLSPAHGTDDRFDSVAQLKSGLDLTQLRGFLNRSGTSRQDPATGDAREVVTSYDLVLRRAREIKAAGDVERDCHLNALNARKAAVSAQAPALATDACDQVPPLAPPASSTRPGVVWDVEAERLNIAFERARVAIDHPVHHAPPLESTYREDAGSIAPPIVEQPAPEPTARVDDGYHAAWLTDDEAHLEEDQLPVELVGYTKDEPSDPAWAAAASPVESPRGSWWRSLNFGLKRRYRSEPMSVPAYMDDDEWAAEDDYAATFNHDGLDVRISFKATDQVDAGAGYEEMPPDGYDDADEIDLIFATSEESWLQDAWEFPELQPVEWQESRSRLLERSPEPVAAAVRADHVLPTDSPQYIYAVADDHPATLRGEHLAGVADVRPASSSFAFDEPSGMDAFRSALFGGPGQTTSPNGVAREMTAAVASVSDRPQEHGSRPVEPDSYTQDRPADRSPGGTSGVSDRSLTRRPLRHAQPQSAFNSDFDIRDAIGDRDAGLDRHFDVASRVPKSCSTCRSFRTSDNGERGWCMNEYAATHRQMVNSDYLACQSSIGDWWLAADTSWIPPTDVIQPETPRTDRLVARSSPREASAPRTARRVRTSKLG